MRYKAVEWLNKILAPIGLKASFYSGFSISSSKRSIFAWGYAVPFGALIDLNYIPKFYGITIRETFFGVMTKSKKQTLQSLLSKITLDNIPEEVNWGKSVGKEDGFDD